MTRNWLSHVIAGSAQKWTPHPCPELQTAKDDEPAMPVGLL